MDENIQRIVTWQVRYPNETEFTPVALDISGFRHEKTIDGTMWGWYDKTYIALKPRVCYTAIIGSVYDELKAPSVISPGWLFICFTDQALTSTVWEIRKVVTGIDPQRNARSIKIGTFKEWQYSLWLDAAFQINIDLNGFWNAQFRSPFTSPRHPLRHCVYHEIDACIANQRGDARQLLAQRAAYAAANVPHHGNNIITSGVLMRENTPGCVELCDEWLREVDAWSVRDQVAFGRVSIGKEFHTFNWDYSQSKELKHYKHNHLKGK